MNIMMTLGFILQSRSNWTGDTCRNLEKNTNPHVPTGDSDLVFGSGWTLGIEIFSQSSPGDLNVQPGQW